MESLPFLYCVTLWSVCFLQFLSLQNVRRVLGTLTLREKRRLNQIYNWRSHGSQSVTAVKLTVVLLQLASVRFVFSCRTTTYHSFSRLGLCSNLKTDRRHQNKQTDKINIKRIAPILYQLLSPFRTFLQRHDDDEKHIAQHSAHYMTSHNKWTGEPTRK